MAGNYIVTVSGLGTVCVAASYEVAYEIWEWYAMLSKQQGRRVSCAVVKLIDPYGDVLHANGD